MTSSRRSLQRTEKVQELTGTTNVFIEEREAN